MKSSLVIFMVFSVLVVNNLINGYNVPCRCRCVRYCKLGIIHPAATCIIGSTPCCYGFTGNFTACAGVLYNVQMEGYTQPILASLDIPLVVMDLLKIGPHVYFIN
ncbi:hypothetical protein RN001_005234 [Aquatica leii]|uniref:Uncharacterized protein n=1 Tax=Aquatica leii TaxID=1421715 RepID=A0AAN7Q6G9_9COLE|nr:hypothetical protein RN001_005234 [Aquatica leii]